MSSNDRNNPRRPPAGRPRPLGNKRGKGPADSPAPDTSNREAGSESRRRSDSPTEGQKKWDPEREMSVWERAQQQENARLQKQREIARKQAEQARRIRARLSASGSQQQESSGKSAARGAQPRGTQPKGTQGRGAQPRGTQPKGAQPRGAQPRGAQPRGMQGRGAQPRGAQPRGAQPRGMQPRGMQPRGTRPRTAQGPARPPQTKQSRETEHNSVRAKLASSFLTRWIVPAKPFHKLNRFDWFAWVLLYVGIAIILLVAMGYALVKSTSLDKVQEANIATRSTLEVPVKIYQCKLSDLDTSIKLPSTQVQYGKPISFGLTITNRGDYPCTIDASPRALGIFIVSGPQTVYNPGTCGPKVRQSLLVDAKTTIEHKIEWDAHLRNQKCEPGDFAPAGTYVATPYMETKLENPAAPFVIK